MENEGWQHISESLLSAISSGHVPYAATVYGRLISAYHASDVNGFNAGHPGIRRISFQDYSGEAEQAETGVSFQSGSTVFAGDDFVRHRFGVRAVFLVGLAEDSWPGQPCILLVGAFLIHTLGLITRMYLQGRPPVTNLYSSAIFVGWASVLLCIILERFYKNGIGSVCGAVIGFVTLLIAHNLQLDGDTLEMLRAVLDTNGWLATHVVGEA